MATRLYPANDQLESLLIEKFGKTTIENYYKFENWAESASLEELQAVSHLRDDDREYVIYKMRNRVEKYCDIYKFINCGWDRPKERTFRVIEEAGLNMGVDSTQDIEIIQKLIDSQGIKTKITITELCWS